MRLGVLSDVHANRHALDAVLRALEDEALQSFVCAGDLVGYGAFPGECVDRVLALPGCVAVAGNHDLVVTGGLSGAAYPRLAVESLAWTRERMLPAQRERLAGLQRCATAIGGVAVAHGTPGDPERYVRTSAEAAEALHAVAEDLLVLGHTHEPRVYAERGGELLRGREGTVALVAGERHLINPGSVGQARERHALARFAVLDLERREVSMRAVRYDLRACRAALRRVGRPTWSCHVSPSRPARLRRRLAGG